MHSIAENKPYYIKAWRHVLEGWLHWSEERIQRWVAAWEADLEGRGSVFFYHETATYYMIPLLIRDALAERLRVHSRGVERASDLIYVEGELFKAAGSGIDECENSFDWDAARKRVESVLGRYGESIPTPEETTEYELRMVG
jgi:hypothetical protein